MSCGSNWIDDKAAMWPLEYIMDNSAKAPWHIINAVKRVTIPRKTENWAKTISHEYLSNHVRSRSRNSGRRCWIYEFWPAWTHVHGWMSESLLREHITFLHVYNEARLKEIFIESLHESVRFSMRGYWHHIMTRRSKDMLNMQRLQ